MSSQVAESEATARRSRQSTRIAPQGEVVVRARPQIKTATASELGFELTHGQMPQVPEDIMQDARQWADDYKASLAQRIQLYSEQLAASRSMHNGQAGPEEGEPSVGNYVGWDLVSISPIQFEALPPYRPNKIIASGELTMLQAVLFINPTVSVPDGFAIPANVQLGNRDVRVSFDQFNLTTGTPGPNFTLVGNLGPAPTASGILIQVFFNAPAVATPQLVEVNVTADVLNLGQPYAAFATWHIDMESSPPFLGLGPVSPQFEYDIPQRYMVYPK